MQDTVTRNRFKLVRAAKAFPLHPEHGHRLAAIPVVVQALDGTWANRHIDQVSADGSIAVGWQEAEWGGWLGTVWHNGRPELIVDANGNPVS